MTTENINLEIARRRVDQYREEAVDIESHFRRGENGHVCSEFLRRGIEAARWLMRADSTLREACYEGLFDFTPDTQAALEALYVEWLRSSQRAEAWIEAQKCRGDLVVDDLLEFQRIRETVEEIVDQRDWMNRSRAIREERMAEEPW